MKIGIITYWSSNDNYGQLLQCFALQKYLRNQGNDAFLIRYLPVKGKSSFFQKIRNNLSWERIVYLCSKQRKLDKAFGFQENRLRNINRQLNKKRDFDSFRSAYIQATDTVYHSLDELRANPPYADVYICGSDQVWNNPLKLRETAAWYLSFGSNKTKRIAYAASIGRNLQKQELPVFARYLKHFTAISVREESSRQLCESLGISNVQTVLDPTLLLPVEEYRNLESLTIPSSHPYLFVYALNISTPEELYWKELKSYLESRFLDLKIVCSSGYMQARELLEDHHNIQATIPEWLHYIDNAQCVITTSFHGVVFCIKMRKPFLAILLTNKYAGGNNRILSLLKSLNLEERIYNPSISIATQMEHPIDWTGTEKRMNELLTASCSFLNKLVL